MSTGMKWVLKKTHRDKQYGVEWYSSSGWVTDVSKAVRFTDRKKAFRAAGSFTQIDGVFGKKFVVRAVLD